MDFLHTNSYRYAPGFNCTFVGPGHGTPIKLNNGDFWYVYHAWRYDRIDVYPPGSDRVMNIDKISWTEDGWPFIGVPSDTYQSSPSVSVTGQDISYSMILRPIHLKLYLRVSLGLPKQPSKISHLGLL